MKFLTYEQETGRPRAGVLKEEDRIVDLTALLDAKETIRDIRALLEQYDDAKKTVEDALSAKGDINTLALSEVKLLAPILVPPSVRDASIFEAHSLAASKDAGFKTPKIWYEYPVFYYQNPNDVVGPEATIYRKKGSVTLDYESEVALIVGRRGRSVAKEDAEKYIFGFTIFNDWSDRACTTREVGFLGIHKGKDFATGLGPYIVTFDEFADIYKDGRFNIKVDVRVNGKVLTDSSTEAMYWTIPDLLAYVSEDTTIVPGDVVAMGTVGDGCICERADVLPYLSDGDTVEIEVERIGLLRQYVGKAS